MFGLGLPEIIIILAAVGVLLFGGKKIVELARSVGRVSGEYKKGKIEIEKELKAAEGELRPPRRDDESRLGQGREAEIKEPEKEKGDKLT